MSRSKTRGPLAWLVAAGTLLCLAGVVETVGAQESEESLVRDLRWRNIGNGNQRGRISSIDALEDDWTHVVVGTASGGVWKSTSGGTEWMPIFDNYGAASIGDVTIHQADPRIIWVGTGEECGRNTAAWGNGVYKSTDGGESFRHMGLHHRFRGPPPGQSGYRLRDGAGKYLGHEQPG